MSHFDEKTKLITSKTEWGLWYQTIDEVVLEVEVPEGSRSKDVSCVITATDLQVAIKGTTYIKGKFFATVISEECVWTIEDRKLLRIVCMKSIRDPGKGWASLLKDQYEADPWTKSEMEKKLTLEKFQREHPGFDFSGAEMTGNYQGGGPNLPTP